MIGTTLNHYEVLEKLGEGGMGHVYLAEDTRLNRRVALKVLPSEMAEDARRIERFEREAKAVAALNHPNIVTIFSVEEADGVRFLTMELVDGQVLDDLIPFGGLDLDEFFDLAVPLASAVTAAHRKGIIHRDIKPANVMVNSEGTVKLLDLGLAKLKATDEDDDPSITNLDALTQDGRVIGTVPYMAPEQLSARPTDHRVDIFSLGIVLYQMLTGGRPFQGKSSAELISSILRDSPTPITEHKTSLPTHLGRVIRKCLEKEPVKRFQNVEDLRNELHEMQRLHRRGELRTPTGQLESPGGRHHLRAQWLTALGVVLSVAIVAGTVFSVSSRSRPAATDIAARSLPDRSIAVFPLDELGEGGPPGFVAGMSQEMTVSLAEMADLGVVSASAASIDRPVRQTASELGVSYVLRGSVRWVGDDTEGSLARLTFELVRAVDERHVWSKSFDRRIDDVLTTQTELARAVRSDIGSALGLVVPPSLLGGGEHEPLDFPAEPAEAQTPTDDIALGPPSAAQRARPKSAHEAAGASTLSDRQVSLSLSSQSASGVITLYADTLQIYRRQFQFAERKGGVLGRVGLKRRVAGELEDGFTVPSGTDSLRLYVALAGRPARQFVIDSALRGDGSDLLTIVIGGDGEMDVQLNDTRFGDSS